MPHLRLIVCRCKYDSISSMMRDLLHWLPIHQRIEFKLCLIVSTVQVFSQLGAKVPLWLLPASLFQSWTAQPLFGRHVVTLLSHRQERPITVRAVLPWQARPRGTHCPRRSMISSYLSPHSGVSWKHTCSAEHTSAHHEHARDCFQLERANINFSI